MEGWENWRFTNDFAYFHTKKYFEYQEIYATLILHDKIKESGDCSMSGLFRALHRTKVFRNLTEQEFAWVLYDVGNSAFIIDRKSTRLNSSHWNKARMPSSA